LPFFYFIAIVGTCAYQWGNIYFTILYSKW